MTWFKCIGQDGGGGGGIKVSALASTSSQCISLPLYSDDNPVIKFKMLQPYFNYIEVIIGDIWDLSAFIWYYDNNANYNMFRYGTGNDDLYRIPPKFWKWVNVEIDYSTSKVIVDGITYGTQTPKTQAHNQIHLFGLPNGSYRSCIALSEMKIFKNNSLYMDLEPRQDSTTGEGYYYDTVNQQSYYSNNGNSPLYYFEDGGETIPSYIDIFSKVNISASNGVSEISNSVINTIGSLSCQESSAGYEGINIAMPNLVVNQTYTVNFDFQYTDANWFTNPPYMSGVNVFNTNKSNYDDLSSWTENLDRDLVKHNHQITFTATATTMYLSFNVCGLDDGRTNYFEITNLYVEETTSS